jgi:hypothetical protein
VKMNSAPLTCLVLCASLAALLACEKEQSAPPPAPQAAAPANTGHGHGAAVIDLGVATIGSFEVKATRDVGEIVAGKDAPIDVTVTPAAGSTATVVAVRFWIGTADAQGSVKARADIENPAEPNRWHTHAEIPAPMPEGSKAWVEIEDDAGATSVGSFDLKR